MASDPTQRLSDLKTAADTYFSGEITRLNNQYDFLNAILQKRGGSVGLQDANSAGASEVLVDSLKEYLGTSLKPAGT